MIINDYTYASKYINDCQKEFGELKRISGTINRYTSIITKITVSLKFDMIQHSNNNWAEDVMASRIDAQNELEMQKKKCISVCSLLKMLDDVDGASIIYYYYILKLNMFKVSEEIGLSVRSCWRHHNIALEQLDEYLRNKGKI